jgi:porin
MRRFRARPLFQAVLGLLLATSAQAQSTFPNSTPLEEQPVPSPLLGTPLQPVVDLSHAMLDAGILPRLRFIDAFAANPVGGLRAGADNAGVVMFGTDFDLNRIAGIAGGQFHLSFAQLYGRDLAKDYIGTRTKVQSYSYPNKEFQLTEFSYQQSFYANALDFVVGRTNATGEFARSTYGCRFENTADCPFELTQLVGGFPGFPYVTWGGRLRVAPTPLTYVKAGAYETNARRPTTDGFDWSINSNSTGYVLPVEVGYEDEAFSATAPEHYRLGVWYNSAAYDDPVLNTRGRNRGLSGGAPLRHSGGRRGIYLLGDRIVWRPEGSRTRGIAVFAGAEAPFDTAETFKEQIVGGLIWTGAIPARPRDQIGLMASYIRLSDSELEYLNGIQQRQRSASRLLPDTFLIELNYAYEIVAGVVIQPAVQYLINPDNINRSTSPTAPRDTLVLGVKFVINANGLLGLPLQLPGVRRPGT